MFFSIGCEQIADRVVEVVIDDELPAVVVEVGAGLAVDGAAQVVVAGTLAVSGVDMVILDFWTGEIFEAGKKLF